MSDAPKDLLGRFARHPVAANLLMLMMILGGIFAIDRLNVQFLPNFSLDMIKVSVEWPGASAEDMETAIVTPLEQSLRSVDYLRKMTSTSSDSLGLIYLELQEDSDTLHVLSQVEQIVDDFRNLPADAERPEVQQMVPYEPVARLLLTGPEHVSELRYLAQRFERELMSAGIAQVQIAGLPEQEIAIEIDSQTQQQLGMGLVEMGDRVDAQSRDFPAGTFGEQDSAYQIRSLNQARSEKAFGQISLVTDEQSRISLGQVAEISRQAQKGGQFLTIDGQPAVELSVNRAESSDSLEAAEILNTWLEKTRPTLPAGVTLEVYDESWQLIKDRISLLVNNGLGGMILVIGILYLFLSSRVAWWVAIGIPVSFMATLLVLYMTGGSLNMVSLFALIMALGIIVDDAIVVGEDALAHHQMGENALLAAEGGARRMLAPVCASSLTTVAAFLPLMLISGPIGNIFFTIPVVIISAIIASLIESFFVLPGHLRGSFRHMHKDTKNNWQARLNQRFNHFRDHVFRRWITLAIDNRAATLALVVAMLLVSIGLLAGGRIAFVFFPSPESTMLYANAYFSPGTPQENVDAFLDHLEKTLHITDRKLAEQSLIKSQVSLHGGAMTSSNKAQQKGTHIGSLKVELIEPDHRNIRNKELIRAWRKHIILPPGLETLTITEKESGPPGRDVEISMHGDNAEQMKAAAMELKAALKEIPGVTEVEDNMPYGREQLIYSLTPTGEALGLTTASLGDQLRAAYEGRLVQLFQDGPDEVEVRVRLPASEREHLNALDRLEIFLDSGETVPLATVATWQTQRGFDTLQHTDTLLAVNVTADVDTDVNNPNRILAGLRNSTLKDLETRYGISFSFEGRAADQAETMEDMQTGLLFGLIMIYLILAWVFASYGWPLLVMTAIPFGLTGALAGHWLMGVDLTVLSMFGFFGLSGIVINDSIILVSFYKELRARGEAIRDALINASCLRLRAVLLTSLTTIAGLVPLLFETSLQAQFLIPMAISIAFGLAFGTLLVLFVIPTMLSCYEELYWRWQERRNRHAQQHPAAIGDRIES